MKKILIFIGFDFVILLQSCCATEFIYPTIVLFIIGSCTYFLNKALKKQINQPKLEESSITFIVKTIIVPLFVGLMAYIVTDRIYGTKEEIRVGIANFGYTYDLTIAEDYRKKYIESANKLLAGYTSAFEFKLVPITSGYSGLIEALNAGFIDVAFVPANTYYHFGDNPSLKIVGVKYLESGKEYYAGFLFPKLKDTQYKESLEDNLSFKCHKILLNKEPLSSSSRVVPVIWLNEKIKKLNKLKFEIDTSYNLPEMVERVRGRTICAISSDMWLHMQIENSQLSKRFSYIPIKDIKIPMDIVLVNNEEWDKRYGRLWQKFVDALKFRNLDITKSRKDIIIEALRGMMVEKTKEKSKIETYAGWSTANAEYVNYIKRYKTSWDSLISNKKCQYIFRRH